MLALTDLHVHRLAVPGQRWLISAFSPLIFRYVLRTLSCIWATPCSIQGYLFGEQFSWICCQFRPQMLSSRIKKQLWKLVICLSPHKRMSKFVVEIFCKVYEIKWFEKVKCHIVVGFRRRKCSVDSKLDSPQTFFFWTIFQSLQSLLNWMVISWECGNSLLPPHPLPFSLLSLLTLSPPSLLTLSPPPTPHPLSSPPLLTLSPLPNS